MKKRKTTKVILIIAVIIIQMLLPTIYSIAAEEETVTIQFQDINFYNAMVDSLASKISAKNDTNMIISMTQENIDSVIEIRIIPQIANNIENISGIEHFKNLFELNISGNISDISPLAELTNLKLLYMNGNEITNINPLTQLTNLYSLTLNNNQISDITALSELKNLKLLYMDNNQISDITALSGLTNLESLTLYNNQITDISALSELENLELLYLEDNQISDVSALSGLTNLKDLMLNKNEIDDINPLVGLTNLEILNLNTNQISNVTPLSGLINLKYLNLNHNKISNISDLSWLINLNWLTLGDNQISDISALKELANLSFFYMTDNKISKNGASGDVIELPQVFLEAQNESSIIYTEDGITLTNCKLSDDKKSVIVENIPATVKINHGNASDTILEINGKINNSDDGLTEEKKGFELGKNNNSFLHTNLEEYNKAGFIGVNNYKVPLKYYEMITKNVAEAEKEKIISEEYKEWNGSCYGIAAMMGLAYYNKIDLSLIQEGVTDFYNLNEPYKDERLLNLIQTYYLSQYLDITEENNKEYMKPLMWGLLNSECNDYENLEQFLQDFVTTVKDEIVQFSYSYAEGGHSILACGCKELEDGSYIIKLYDMNSVNNNQINGAFEYMTISSDFKKFNIDNRINEENYRIINFMKLDAYDDIGIEENSAISQINKNDMKIGFSSNSNFTITNSKNETLTYNGENLSGDMNIIDIDLITKGENEAELEITIPYNEIITYKENNSKTDLYIHDNGYFMSVEGENIDKINVDIDNSVDIEGENYEVHAQIDNINGGLYEINANAEGLMQLTREDDNIKVKSEKDLKNVDINELTVEKKKDLQDGINGKNIVISKEGKITIEKTHTDNYTENNFVDDTIAKNELPNTGKLILIVSMILLAIVSVVLYMTYKKYKMI